MLHTHCEELSLELQLAGVRELCRHLALVRAAVAGEDAAAAAEKQLRYCVLNSVAKASLRRPHSCGGTGSMHAVAA